MSGPATPATGTGAAAAAASGSDGKGGLITRISRRSPTGAGIRLSPSGTGSRRCRPAAPRHPSSAPRPPPVRPESRRHPRRVRARGTRYSRRSVRWPAKTAGSGGILGELRSNSPATPSVPVTPPIELLARATRLSGDAPVKAGIASGWGGIAIARTAGAAAVAEGSVPPDGYRQGRIRRRRRRDRCVRHRRHDHRRRVDRRRVTGGVRPAAW